MQLGVREPLVDVSIDENDGTVKVVAEMQAQTKQASRSTPLRNR